MLQQPEKLLAPLPYPVTFVCNYAQRWSELFTSSEDELRELDSLNKRIITNEDCWIVLTYLYLKRRGLNVYISPKFTPQSICVASAIDFGIRKGTFSSFVVGCRSDGPKPVLCDFAIVQNEANIESSTDILIPHWSQPGLVPRMLERGNRIENLVYKGSSSNLSEAFRSTQFQAELARLGVRLVMNIKADDGSHNWHDYSNADLVLAVREITQKDALVKPASKLVNAWLAGVPALLGPEPAFQHLRRSPLDYMEVRTPQEVLEAIRRLQQEPSLYQQIVANGLRRGEAFTVERIAQIWRDVLAGPVTENYLQWRKRSHFRRMGEFVLRAVHQKIARYQASYHRQHGPRLLSGKLT